MAAKDATSSTPVLTTLFSLINTTKPPCSINPYDTAWAAMVAKPSADGSSEEWLFPQSYLYLLDTWNSDGSWYANLSDLDALLSTLAALLALLKHQNHPKTIGCLPVTDLTMRISRVVSWLEFTMRKFDVERCTDNVGFEILIPSLLRLLGKYDVLFDIPYIQTLMKLAKSKMVKVDKLAQALYQGCQVTVLHSLEAFIGLIDFDQLKGCKRNGGMLGSPS
jgi:hypothetical protein